MSPQKLPAVVAPALLAAVGVVVVGPLFWSHS